jgi:hypothetical protein
MPWRSERCRRKTQVSPLMRPEASATLPWSPELSCGCRVLADQRYSKLVGLVGNPKEEDLTKVARLLPTLTAALGESTRG